MKSKRKGRILSTKFKSKAKEKYPLTRCKTCPLRYSGIVRDGKSKKIDKVLSCIDSCVYVRLEKAT